MPSTTRPAVPVLALDHDLVLSAWEEIGGDIFTCGDALSPATITLDLSDVELSLKQSSSASLDHLSNVSVVPNLFPSFTDLHGQSYCGSSGLMAGYAAHDKQAACWTPQLQSFAIPSHPAHLAQLLPDKGGADMGQVERAGGASSSSISSSSIDVAVVPEVSSQPAIPGMQGSPTAKVPQLYLPNMLPAPQAGNGNRIPGEADAWRTRRECLERYKEKKARRMYTKKIRYQLRKINADKRPRIKGRFVKKEELDEYIKGGATCVVKAAEEEISDVDEDDAISDKEEPV